MFLLLIPAISSTATICIDLSKNYQSMCPSGAKYYTDISKVSYLADDEEMKVYVFPIGNANVSYVFLDFTEINENIKYTVDGVNKAKPYTNVMVKTVPQISYLRLRYLNILPNSGDHTEFNGTVYLTYSTIADNNIINTNSCLFAHDSAVIPYIGSIVTYTYGLLDATTISKSYTVNLTSKITCSRQFPMVQISDVTNANISLNPESLKFQIADEPNAITIIPDDFHAVKCESETLNIVVDDTGFNKSFYALSQYTAENEITAKLTINNPMSDMLEKNSFSFTGSQFTGDLTGDLSHVQISLSSIEETVFSSKRSESLKYVPSLVMVTRAADAYALNELNDADLVIDQFSKNRNTISRRDKGQMSSEIGSVNQLNDTETIRQ